MKNLEVTTENALTAFKNADDKGKMLLSNLFGEKVFLLKITDRVKTFEGACAICPPSDQVKILLDYNGVDKDMIGAQAAAKLFIIARALNEGWEPDWNDSNQYKYYPYFKFKAGFGFSYTNSVNAYSPTYVGSRLCFKTSALAEYAGKQFETIYKDYLTI